MEKYIWRKTKDIIHLYFTWRSKLSAFSKWTVCFISLSMICLKKSKKKKLILYIPLLTEIKYTSKTHSLKKLKLIFFFKFITRQRQCRKSDRGLWKIQLLYFGACVFLASLTYKFLEIKQTMHERPAARTYIFQGSSKIKLLYRLRNISISSIVFNCGVQ